MGMTREKVGFIYAKPNISGGVTPMFKPPIGHRPPAGEAARATALEQLAHQARKRAAGSRRPPLVVQDAQLRTLAPLAQGGGGEGAAAGPTL